MRVYVIANQHARHNYSGKLEAQGGVAARCDQPVPVSAERGFPLTYRRLTSTSRAACTVASIMSSVCANDTNAASNCEGGR